jgi:hypothetical protein
MTLATDKEWEVNNTWFHVQKGINVRMTQRKKVDLENV